MRDALFQVMYFKAFISTCIQKFFFKFFHYAQTSKLICFLFIHFILSLYLLSWKVYFDRKHFSLQETLVRSTAINCSSMDQSRVPPLPFHKPQYHITQGSSLRPMANSDKTHSTETRDGKGVGGFKQPSKTNSSYSQ